MSNGVSNHSIQPTGDEESHSDCYNANVPQAPEVNSVEFETCVGVLTKFIKCKGCDPNHQEYLGCMYPIVTPLDQYAVVKAKEDDEEQHLEHLEV